MDRFEGFMVAPCFGLTRIIPGGIAGTGGEFSNRGGVAGRSEANDLMG